MFPKVSGGTNPKKAQDENIDMRLAQIKNGYMYNSDEPEKTHTYVVYRDNKTKEVRAIEATHLYLPDKKNMKKLKQGLLHKVQFDIFETPSVTNNYYYNTDINGKPIDLTNKSVSILGSSLPQKQAKEIKDFARTARKR